MKGMMLTSRWGALVFVGVTMIGAALLVGTEEHDGALLDATAQIEQQTGTTTKQAEPVSEPQPAPLPSPIPATSSEEPVFEFTSDEDLIVDPTGFDPTPIVNDPAAGEVVVVETESETETEQSVAD